MHTIFNSVNEVLRFAIREEEAAHEFYISMMNITSDKRLRRVFHDFAEEEMSHREKLEEILQKKDAFDTPEAGREIKVSDFAVSGDYIGPGGQGSEIQKLYAMAMTKEKASFKLYSDLADMATDEPCRQLLLSLAQEEAKHKLKLELEYEQQFMQDN